MAAKWEALRLAKKIEDSEFIFNDGHTKGRLVKKDKDWYEAQWKYIVDKDGHGNANKTFADDKENRWATWIAGTVEWLGLSEKEKEWAK